MAISYYDGDKEEKETHACNSATSISTYQTKSMKCPDYLINSFIVGISRHDLLLLRHNVIRWIHIGIY